jgi:hypothetical protein
VRVAPDEDAATAGICAAKRVLRAFDVNLN